ncbi:hypothetical protein HT746_19880 [Burkholderia pyrrocinia]|uniref:hypothetical protein n=1 Tax=Burkholderia pyrrocinia TaxID=60550 RepID=UPI001575E682|nr:hypothetical protein [Burkholderia pyrrocinia]NTX29357.1 hypothetical protein [Burkholderia pyrrocinia]QVN23938.1 hypothetical protein JYG32_38645 [Burkholderia pyrrocinia]
MSADSPSDRLRTPRAGFDDHLVKPVETATRDALFQRVARDLLPDAWFIFSRFANPQWRYESSATIHGGPDF